MLNNFIQNILDKIQGNSWSEGGVVYSKDIYERPIPFFKTIRRNNMKKAILVGDYASVEELNKLFQQGYTVESVDDRSVYILERDESRAEPIKRKVLDHDISTNITLDTSKQPHIRIEFDDIRDVPKVFVDGELIGDGADDKPLVSLKVDWNTDTATENHKGFDVSYFDMTDRRGKSTGFHEGSVM